MATKKHSSSSRNPAYGGDPLSLEERKLVGMYRCIGSRWEKNALFILMQSFAWGRFSPKGTDKMPWPQMRKLLGLAKVRGTE